MKLEPADDQPGYVVAEFRVNGDGWHHYYGWPDAPPGTPYKFTPRGTTIKELVYGSLASRRAVAAAVGAARAGLGHASHRVPRHRRRRQHRDGEGVPGDVHAVAGLHADHHGAASKGELRVTSGVTCVDGATIHGPVTVAAGASLVAQNATFTGGITATGAARSSSSAARCRAHARHRHDRPRDDLRRDDRRRDRCRLKTAKPALVAGNTIRGSLGS